MLSLPLEEIENITDIDIVKNQYHLIIKDEQNLDAALGENHNVRDTIVALNDQSNPKLALQITQAEKLRERISKTNELAESISKKVRQLDLQQNRVKQTINVVEDVQSLNLCASGVEEALKDEDVELACSYINKYLQFNRKDLSRISPKPVEICASAQVTLTDLISEKFDTAVSRGDQGKIVTFIKLFPLIGCHTLGIDKFGAFLGGQISRQCQDSMKALQTDSGSSGHLQYAALLTKLYEFVASLIDGQSGMIETCYGETGGYMLQLVIKLHRAAELQAGIILDTFTEKSNIQRKIFDIKQARSRGKKSVDVDVKELDLVLDEVSAISQRTTYFHRFIRSRSRALVEKSPLKDGQVDLLDKDGVSKVNKLAEKVDALMVDYVAMELYYIEKTIEKAITIDSYDAGYTSTVVDDVFFIIKKSTNRVVGSFNSEALSVFISTLGKLLENEYVQHFQNSIANSDTDIKDGRVSFMVLVNNLDVSCDYMVQLTKNIEATPEVSAAIPLFLEYGKNFRSLVKNYVENLFVGTVRPKIKFVLSDAYNGIKYVLTEDEYVDETFLKRFINGFEKILKLYKQSYTENNFETMMKFACDILAKEWEKHIMGCKFNQLGALRFDKDLRAVTNFICNNLSGNRDAFTRLNQISTILNFETLGEIHEVWGPNATGMSIKWRLTANEIRKVLVLRNEFSSEEIKKIKL